MKKNLFITMILVLSVAFLSDCKDDTAKPATMDDVLPVSIKTDPSAALVDMRVESLNHDVVSTNGSFGGRTPYFTTMKFRRAGLTKENLDDITIVIEVRKRGYYDIIERFNLKSIMSDWKIDKYYELVKKPDKK